MPLTTGKIVEIVRRRDLDGPGSKGGIGGLGIQLSEAELAALMKLRVCSMGPRIFRCETAPVAALSALMYATDNL